MASTFILIPHSEEFDPVYSGFLKPVLEEAGFTVQRAGDILSTQNILRDIFEAIANSDLIVADLTGSNANVFYELGIAHACGKTVILLTQAVYDVPFDLRGYRLIEYDPYFTEIDKAKRTLADYAEKFQKGTLPARHPVSDFFPDGHLPISGDDGIHQPGEPPSSDIPLDEDPPGFLDSLIQAEDHFNGMSEILERVSGSLGRMTDGISDATKDLERINANPNRSSARAAQNVCRRFSKKVGAFNDVLKPANTEFAETIGEVQEDVAEILSFQGEYIESTAQRVSEQRESLQVLLDSGTVALESLNGLISSFESVPRMERQLDRQLQIGVDELYKMGGNISRLTTWGSAVVSRMDEMLEREEYGESAQSR